MKAAMNKLTHAEETAVVVITTTVTTESIPRHFVMPRVETEDTDGGCVQLKLAIGDYLDEQITDKGMEEPCIEMMTRDLAEWLADHGWVPSKDADSVTWEYFDEK